MRYLRLFCATATLMCAFALTTYAGGIECDGIAPPPPDPTATSTGDIECGGLQVAASLIQAVLSLS